MFRGTAVSRYPWSTRSSPRTPRARLKVPTGHPENCRTFPNVAPRFYHVGRNQSIMYVVRNRSLAQWCHSFNGRPRYRRIAWEGGRSPGGRSAASRINCPCAGSEFLRRSVRFLAASTYRTCGVSILRACIPSAVRQIQAY